MGTDGPYFLGKDAPQEGWGVMQVASSSRKFRVLMGSGLTRLETLNALLYMTVRSGTVYGAKALAVKVSANS